MIKKCYWEILFVPYSCMESLLTSSTSFIGPIVIITKKPGKCLWGVTCFNSITLFSICNGLKSMMRRKKNYIRMLKIEINFYKPSRLIQGSHWLICLDNPVFRQAPRKKSRPWNWDLIEEKLFKTSMLKWCQTSQMKRKNLINQWWAVKDFPKTIEKKCGISYLVKRRNVRRKKNTSTPNYSKLRRRVRSVVRWWVVRIYRMFRTNRLSTNSNTLSRSILRVPLWTKSWKIAKREM